MKLSQVMTEYGQLSGEERFRLILAASGRNDEAERTKLAHASQTRTLTITDHWPYAQAFSELASLAYIELVEEASIYHDLMMFRGRHDPQADSEPELGEDEVADPQWIKELNAVLMHGCLLHMKWNGWLRFCKKLSVPDQLLWEGYPGYSRLLKLLEISKKFAFTPKGFMRWLNRQRPAGSPKLKRMIYSSKAVAREYEQMYQQRARWWGAKP